MSTSTVALATADATTVDHAAEPQADLWTSDSQREAARTGREPAATDEATVPAPVVADEPEPAVAEEETPTEPAPLPRDAAGQFQKRGKPRSDPQARVEAATRKEAQAKEEARQARAEVERLRAEVERHTAEAARLRQPVAAPPAEGADLERFWQDPLSVARELARREAADLYAAQQQAQLERAELASYAQQVTELKQEHPDFDDVVKQAPDVPGVILLAVRQSQMGARIAYDLGTHPEDTAQLARECAALSIDAVPMVRRLLEARVTATAGARPDSASSAVRPSAAAPPVNRVGGTASRTPVESEDLEFGPEYIRRENAREKKAREAGRW